MELNKKQLELVENIFKNYNHCELGQALEQYESDYIMVPYRHEILPIRDDNYIRISK